MLAREYIAEPLICSTLANNVYSYLGAAPLVKDPAILSAAASIVTVESRHQTFIRSKEFDDLMENPMLTCSFQPSVGMHPFHKRLM